jgi:hypothetical protein
MFNRRPSRRVAPTDEAVSPTPTVTRGRRFFQTFNRGNCGGLKMQRYIPPKVPAGSHLRYFNLLTDAEKSRSVKRLLKAGHTRQRVADLTGLTLFAIQEITSAPVFWPDDE